MKKKKVLSIQHTVSGKATMLFVSLTGTPGFIDDMKWGHQSPTVLVKVKTWDFYFDFKFPFVHRKEHSIGYWNLKGKI